MTQPKRAPAKPGWADIPPRDWGERQAKQVADEIRRLRDPNSAQWLANETKKLGYEVKRSVIADLENGRRRHVTTAELIVLAAALDTAPITLLYPPPYDEMIELVPDVMEPKTGAVDWFCADLNAIKYRPRKGPVDDFHNRTQPLYAARAVGGLEDARRSLLGTLARETDQDSPLAQSIRRELDRIARQLAEYQGGSDGG